MRPFVNNGEEMNKEFYIITKLINGRAPIGQSAVGYCYYKPTEKIERLLNYNIKAIDHKFLGVISQLDP